MPFAVGHCGPYIEGVGDAEEDIVDVIIDISILEEVELPPDDTVAGDDDDDGTWLDDD